MLACYGWKLQAPTSVGVEYVVERSVIAAHIAYHDELTVCGWIAVIPSLSSFDSHLRAFSSDLLQICMTRLA